MPPLARVPRRLLIIFISAWIALPSPASAQGAHQPPARPTEPFRREHAEVKVHLGHADAWGLDPILSRFPRRGPCAGVGHRA
jgi:hypothetical protein